MGDTASDPLSDKLIEYLKKIHKRDLTEIEIKACVTASKSAKTSNRGSFIMTWEQFEILSQLSMLPKSKICPGMWKLQLHPKNGFIHCDESGMYSVIQMKLPHMTNEVPYFRMQFGPAFPIRWCEIYEKINSLKVKPLFVLYCYNDKDLLSSNEWIHYYDNSIEGNVASSIFCGGGRSYHEPSAKPCDIHYSFRGEFYHGDIVHTYELSKHDSVTVYINDDNKGIHVCQHVYYKNNDDMKNILLLLSEKYGAVFYQ